MDSIRLGCFLEGEGKAWFDDLSYEQDSVRTSIIRPAYRLKGKNVHIAVLTGPATASSGEITAVAFMGKPNARHFGQPTAGYATTNSTIRMSDGAIVFLTTSVYGDRNKRSVNEQVVPDVIVATEEEKDAALTAALKWLEEN
jgi:C-terminal processing protease CtpA/Prc